jgi:hypothetical protein
MQSNSNIYTKKQIYKELAELYFLPPANAKGVNRKYLEAIRSKTVYCVCLKDMKRFLCGLTPSQLKKSLYIQRYEVYRKLTVLLAETKQLPLGFDNGIIPDGTWLYPIARFIDRCNVCEIFEVSIEEIGTSQANSHNVMIAKQRAEKFLMFESGLIKIEAIRKRIKSLAEKHRRLRSRESELQSLQIYGQSLANQIENDRKNVERELITTTMIVCMQAESKTMEEVLNEKEITQQKEVLSMLRLIYASDNVLDREEWMGPICQRYY